jgi:hypothetical protein
VNNNPMVAVLLLTVMTACAQPDGTGGGSESDGIVSGPVPPAPAGSPARPRIVAATPGLIQVRPAGWVRAHPRANGRQVLLDYWATPCTGVDHIDVHYEEDRVVLTRYEGVDPQQAGRPCTQLAEYRAVSVDLDQPIAGRRLVDGAPPLDPPAGHATSP